MNPRILLLVISFVVLLLVLRLTSSPPYVEHSKSEEGENIIDAKHQKEQPEYENQEIEIKPNKIPKSLKRNQNKEQQPQQLLKGVILYLYGGRWHNYFVQNALPRLDEYFVSCFPYPILVFHEDATSQQKEGIRNSVPKGNDAYKNKLSKEEKVSFFSNNNNEEEKEKQENSETTTIEDDGGIIKFDNVAEVWKKLPSFISESKLKTWTLEQRKFQGRGYRIMCRFWFGLAWLRNSLDHFDYYWRLDTDSIFTRPLTIDPFVLVFKQRKCVYGYNRLKGENPYVVVGLFDTFKKFLETDSLVAEKISEQEKRECIRWVTIRSDGYISNSKLPRNKLQSSGTEKNPAFWAPMYYNNFEMGTMKLKRSELYQRFFRFVDENQPYGIFRHRWGDAPLHTLGILVAQHCSVKTFCNVSFQEVPYRHAVTRIPKMISASSCPLRN